MPSDTTTPRPSLRRVEQVYILDMGDGENRFNPERMDALAEALDQVARAPEPSALVTAASGKFWSNGLDLEWFASHPEQAQAAADQLHRLLAAVLGAGVPTVAAVQGHAFAAGAMLASAHDQIVMREDRGYWCVPEVELRLPFTPGMSALLSARLPRRTAHEAMTTGRRYGAGEALAAGIVDEIAPEDGVLERALERAAAIAGKDHQTLAAIKGRLYGETLATLRATQPL
jgi:enoyl-CoA hydratase/carnithine racemase